MKVEKLDTIVELSSESKGESPTLIPTLKLCPLQRGSEEKKHAPFAWTTPSSSRLQPSMKQSGVVCTIFPFAIGIIPPKDCKLICKVCKTIPSCLNTSDAQIYYCYSENPNMTRVAIHLGKHTHPVAKGTYKDSAKEISEPIVKQVAKTPTATNSAITLPTNKDFLTNHLFHRGDGEKKILKGEEMEEVMDRFQMLSSPSIQNIISSFRSNNRGGVIDNKMTMKIESKFKFKHDKVFPGQGKEKVYVFKMLTKGPGSGVDLIRCMQVGGDLQNAWMMFDHVKRVKDWTMMACHVYDSQYKKVMTIAICDKVWCL